MGCDEILSIIPNIRSLFQLVSSSQVVGDTSGIPASYLNEIMEEKKKVRANSQLPSVKKSSWSFCRTSSFHHSFVQIDNIIILSDGMNLESSEGRTVTDFLRKYRRLINPDLMFVSVDLSGSSAG